MNHQEHYHQFHQQELATAIRYLNDVWLKRPERMNNLEVRCIDGEYGYYDLDTEECKRVLSEQEIIDEAQHYRLVEWRRAYFKNVGECLLQCSVCGEKFQSCSQHIAPCVEASNAS